MDSFMAGFILYLLYEKKAVTNKKVKNTKYLLWIVLLILITVIIINKTPNKSALFFTTAGYTIIAIVYACFLYLTLERKNKLINAITLNNLMRFTGKISYGIYIFHWPVYLFGFTLLNYVFNKLHFSTEGVSFRLINACCCIPITFFISHLSFKYYESYFLKWKVRSGRQLNSLT